MAPRKSQSIYRRVRAEIADLLGINPDTATFGQRLRLDQATAIRLELDRLQAAQLAGHPIDIARLCAATQELEKMLPKDATRGGWDLSRLSDEELRLAERLGAKATGDDTVGDIVETFKIQFVAPPSNERIVTDFQRQITMLEERNGNQVAQISALRREIAELKDTQ